MIQVVTKDDTVDHIPRIPGILAEGYALQSPLEGPPEPPFWVKWLDPFTLEMLFQRTINDAACHVCDQLLANDTLMHRIKARPSSALQVT